MTNVDTFGAYVRHRLERWGDEYALARDCEYLGHQSRNVLQVLIDHKGEMPERLVGFKPMEVDQEAQRIEDIVSRMARSDLELATVMRAWYCGQGRRLHERWDICNELLAGLELPSIRREAYRLNHARGFDLARKEITVLVQAA